MINNNDNKLGRDAQAIAAAEQQLAHGAGVVILIIIAKREGDARGRAAAPLVVLVLWWLWNGIKMRIARLERVLRNERGAAIGGGQRRFPPYFIMIRIEDWDHDHSDVKSARRVVANLIVGVEERHVAEPLAERLSGIMRSWRSA